MKPKTLQEIGTEVGALVTEKNQAYGNSFELSKNILHILFPNGVSTDKYQDMLTITRVIDKLFRVATRKDAFGENPWQDIAGYAVLAMWNQQDKSSAQTGQTGQTQQPKKDENERRLYNAMDAVAYGKAKDFQAVAKACLRGKWVWMGKEGDVFAADVDPHAPENLKAWSNRNAPGFEEF